MGRERRRSCSSSSSSSSSSSDSEKKGKHEKHGKFGFGHAMPVAAASGLSHGNTLLNTSHISSPSTQMPNMPGSDNPPPYPAHTRPAAPPPSGYRVPLTTEQPFPNQMQTRYPPFVDSDGRNPIFIGSALMERAVHPCKIGPTMSPPVRVPYAGTEYAHHGRYDLLPFDPEAMEWVRTSHGRIPPGRRPIEGGYEEGGQKLYHAAANMHGCMVPGKTGEHLVRDYPDFVGFDSLIACARAPLMLPSEGMSIKCARTTTYCR
jgi:hypothetical protein